MEGRAGGHRLRAAAVWPLVAAVALLGVAPAVAATPTGADRSAQVQTLLDRVLGPGDSVVEIAATVQVDSATRTSVTWGGTLPAAVAGATTIGAGRVSSSSVQVGAVDRTTTSVAIPAGALVQQTVAVAVDRAAARAIPTARLRRLIAAAVGLTPSRGDRLVLVRTVFARPVAARAAAPSWSAALLPLAVPAIEAAGGAAAVLIAVLALRRRSRPAASDLRGS